MTSRTVGRSDSRTATLVTAFLALMLPPGSLSAQQLRVAAWGTYERMTETDRDDWSVVGGQVTLARRRGDATWIAAERLGRFGTEDLAARLGGMLHPASRWWLSAEAATAVDPEFAPKNAWELDVSALVGPRVSAGFGYRRQNYLVGAVDVLMPHLSVELRGVSWDARVFVSRNPSERTDVAVFARATIPVGRRGATWLGAAAGRESYLVVDTLGTRTVSSLHIVTGVVGARYDAGNGLRLRADLSIVRSAPLSRRGISVGIERSF